MLLEISDIFTTVVLSQDIRKLGEFIQFGLGKIGFFALAEYG
jgi:hypothetical protein